ncbi:MAG TPA: AraC family transcriptional regulator ligand-binding domain-containing protein [Pyrinomonadaceae bacterium]|nr:AraC family transcriptional regulator ligand-binding domain-containing protein [Pyrinomonadaceae bacterium]
MIEPTVAADFAGAFLEFAVARGAHRTTLTERSGMASGNLSEPDARVPLATYLDLIKAAIELCDEPALALLFGAEVSFSNISILGLIGCSSAEEARQQLNRYAPLLIDGGEGATAHRFEFVRAEASVWVKFLSTLFAEHRWLAESAFARCFCDGKRMAAAAGDAGQWPSPKAIRFTHAEPSYRAEYDRIFGVPLEFRSSMNAILFGEELLSMQMPPTNRYVSSLATERAEALLEKLQNSRTTRGRIESLLLPLLHTGEARIETIARQLGVSRQTLFRKLKAEGVTFEQVLDELRQKQALVYLKGKDVSVTEAAYLLGFSDPAAFSRAFKRWTGASPSAMKASSSAPGS